MLNVDTIDRPNVMNTTVTQRTKRTKFQPDNSTAEGSCELWNMSVIKASWTVNYPIDVRGRENAILSKRMTVLQMKNGSVQRTNEIAGMKLTT